MTSGNSTPEDATEPPKQDDTNPKKRPLAEDSDAEKLAARREANRIHALKSRQRSKALLQELQRTVTQLSGDKAELERENAVMRAQIEVLQQQNLALTQSQRMLLMRSGQLGGTPGAAMNAFAPGLFGLSQAASMPAAAPATTNSSTVAGNANAAPGGAASAAPGSEQQAGGLDQAAVAAAAAAMIQGQAAAAAAAAAGFPSQFQQFMAGFGVGGVPAPAALAPTPGAAASIANSSAVSASTPVATTPATTAAPTPAPMPAAPAALVPPPTQAPPPATAAEPVGTMGHVPTPLPPQPQMQALAEDPLV